MQDWVTAAMLLTPGGKKGKGNHNPHNSHMTSPDAPHGNKPHGDADGSGKPKDGDDGGGKKQEGDDGSATKPKSNAPESNNKKGKDGEAYAEGGDASLRRNKKLVDEVEAKAIEIIESNPSKKDRGPCLSGVYDPVTGKTFYGQNFKNNSTGFEAYKKWLSDPPEKGGADPIIKQKIADYEAKINSGEITPPETADKRLGAHSEIRAYDQALKARREAGISVDENSIKEMDLHNRDLWNLDENGIPKEKIRCPHCNVLTDGINTHGHN